MRGETLGAFAGVILVVGGITWAVTVPSPKHYVGGGALRGDTQGSYVNPQDGSFWVVLPKATPTGVPLNCVFRAIVPPGGNTVVATTEQRGVTVTARPGLGPKVDGTFPLPLPQSEVVFVQADCATVVSPFSLPWR